MTPAEILTFADEIAYLQEPNREIDAKIGILFGWKQECDPKWGIGAPHWYRNGKSAQEIIGYHYGNNSSHLPYFTASYDAAMSLLPAWLTPNIIGHEREVRLLNGIGLTVGGSDWCSRATLLPCGIVTSALKYLAYTLKNKE